MFRGVTGCIIMGAGLAAGAVLSSVCVILCSLVAGLVITAASCELGRRKDLQKWKDSITYPEYKY